MTVVPEGDEVATDGSIRVKSNLPYYIWKCARSLYLLRIPFLPFLLQQFNRVMFCCLVPYKTVLGKNVHLSHLGMGIVVNPDVVIGNNVKINQHVTIGGVGQQKCPVIDDDVHIGAGAKVLGAVHIGRGARIGANAVVLCDVPPGATAVGIPARIIIKGDTPASVKSHGLDQDPEHHRTGSSGR